MKFRLAFGAYSLSLLCVLISSPVDGFTQDSGPIPVIVTKVEHREFSDRVEALGTLRANESVVISSSTTNVVTSVNFEDGQRVSAEDVLVQMTDSEEQAQLSEARSAFLEAEKQYERSTTLLQQKVIPASTVDQQRREFEVARARLRAIEARLAELLIKAPFDGVLGLRMVSRGALLQPGDRITTIDDDSVMKMDFSVPSLYLRFLRVGLSVEASTLAYPGRTFTGSISSINSQVDPVTRSVLVRALIPNPDYLLRPGLLMQVSVLQENTQGLAVPEEALVAEGSKQFIFFVESEGEDKKVRKQEVKIGLREAGVVQIVDGLAADQTIVRDGALKLRDGAVVQTLDEMPRTK